jgi:hypothetical protein
MHLVHLVQVVYVNSTDTVHAVYVVCLYFYACASVTSSGYGYSTHPPRKDSPRHTSLDRRFWTHDIWNISMQQYSTVSDLR